MNEHKPSLVDRVAWGVWQVYFNLLRWLIAILYAPIWAYRVERLVQEQRNLFALEDAAQAAAFRHLHETLQRVEDALADRNVLELDSGGAQQSADVALQAFLRRLVEIESRPLR